MKKLILTIICLSALSFAQDESSSPWGIYGGITSAGTSESDGRTTGLSLGFSYTANDMWSFGAGLSHRGGMYEFDEQDGFSGSADLTGNAIEFWSSYSLMQFDIFSLSTGLIYAHIYEFEVDFEGMSFSESETDNDYGLFLNGFMPLQENLGLNIGYYMGLRDMGSDEKFNNFWIEIGYGF